ncbi:MAG: hypothetical protein HQL01_02185 [Nitrospirae bacterium]|nr:hypothetical protein [Nitrospirota bacterium]
MKFILYLTVLLFTVSLSVTAYAKPKVKDNATLRQETSPQAVEDPYRKLQVIQRQKMAEALGLDKHQTERIMSSLDKYDNIVSELAHSISKDMADLAEAIKFKKDDIIQGLIDKIELKESELKAIKQKEYDELKQHLTLQQKAKYIFLKIDIRKDIADMFDDEKVKDKIRQYHQKDQ